MRTILSSHGSPIKCVVTALVLCWASLTSADSIPATMTNAPLQVSVFATNLQTPIGIVFIAINDALVLERTNGMIKRVLNGVIQSSPVLDLHVNYNSEYGLSSAVLHPNFPGTPRVFIRWTQSNTNSDTIDPLNVHLLGNRVDSFIWNGSSLVFERNIIYLRALQDGSTDVSGHPESANPQNRGDHNGGPMTFGPDGKLYIFVGDLGRRGQLQNLSNGPFLTLPRLDDRHGGPEPDAPHFSGIILRLNEDGSAPSDNPFYTYGAQMSGAAGQNVQKIYSYGHRNGFGISFDPVTGNLWESENGDDAFAEINRVIRGMNGGWVQIMGPTNRFAEFGRIETTTGDISISLQEVRFPASHLASEVSSALARMYYLPGAQYVDPDFSWKYDTAPAGTAFITNNALGAQYNGTLWVGSGRSFEKAKGGTGGSLFCFKLTADRLHLDLSADSRLADRVADNTEKFNATESESLIIGRGFGVTPDIKQGPDGNVYVVSHSDGAIYKISPLPRLAPPVNVRIVN